MNIFKLLISGIVLFYFTGCVQTQQVLPPKYYYDGSYIQMHSPDSEGWIKLKEDDIQITFGKKGNIEGESYIARVVFFPIEKSKTKEEFLNTIKNDINQYNKERFELVKSNIKLNGRKSYPCVEVKYILKDKEATISTFSKTELFMNTKALYCKDPKRENAGFMIGYSFRGYSINPNLDKEADSFIKGVYFKDYK